MNDPEAKPSGIVIIVTKTILKNATDSQRGYTNYNYKTDQNSHPFFKEWGGVVKNKQTVL